MNVINISIKNFISMMENFQLSNEQVEIKNRIEYILRKIKPSVLTSIINHTMISFFVKNKAAFINDSQNRPVEKIVSSQQKLIS